MLSCGMCVLFTILRKHLQFVSTFLDPQTSGGLLVACAPEAVEEVLRTFREGGFEFAAVVGSLVEGSGLQVD